MTSEKRTELVERGVEVAKQLGAAFAAGKSPMEAGIVGSLSGLIQQTPEFVAKGLFKQDVFVADPEVAKKAQELKDKLAALEAEVSRLKAEKASLDTGRSVQETSLEEIIELGVRALTTPGNKIPGGSGTPWEAALGKPLYTEVFPDGIPQSNRGRKPSGPKEEEAPAQEDPKVRVNGKEVAKK